MNDEKKCNLCEPEPCRDQCQEVKRIDLIKDLEICAKATAGPWFIEKEKLIDETLGFIISNKGEGETSDKCLMLWSQFFCPKEGDILEQLEADAEFITAAREGWPATINLLLQAVQLIVSIETVTIETPINGNIYAIRFCPFCQGQGEHKESCSFIEFMDKLQPPFEGGGEDATI